MKYTLRCIAPDGASVREGEFDSIESAWDRASEMGSRWFFYPFHVVTGSCDPDKCRVVSAPDGYDFLRSLKFKTVRTWISLNSSTIFPD